LPTGERGKSTVQVWAPPLLWKSKGLAIFLPTSGSWTGHRTSQPDIHTWNFELQRDGHKGKEAVEKLTWKSRGGGNIV